MHQVENAEGLEGPRGSDQEPVPSAGRAPETSPGTVSRLLIDDFLFEVPLSNLHTEWKPVTDQVMGGVSRAHLRRHVLDGHGCQTLSAQVSTANQGGFAQMTLSLSPDQGEMDASAYSGIEIIVRGNDEDYAVHLKTGDISRPWQSYRSCFHADHDWQTLYLPFSAFKAHRIEKELDTRRLTKVGIVAIGRDFDAEVSVARLSLVS